MYVKKENKRKEKRHTMQPSIWGVHYNPSPSNAMLEFLDYIQGCGVEWKMIRLQLQTPTQYQLFPIQISSKFISQFQLILIFYMANNKIYIKLNLSIIYIN